MSISFKERVGNDTLKSSRPQAEKNTNSHDPFGASAPVSLVPHPSGEPAVLKRSQTGAAPMTGVSESVITFTVAGLFGAGRLASRLKELESVDLIGPWHVGHWMDYTHKAIRIRFSSRTDARTAVSKVGSSVEPPPPGAQAGGAPAFEGQDDARLQ
jgi:hypothetical protein